MGKVTWQYSLFIEKSFNLYSQQDFSFKNSLLYSRQFAKFADAIVPNYCYLQELTSGGKKIPILHASLPVDIDISLCHKFLWSARHGEITLVKHPDTLEIFCVLTCVQRNQEQVSQGNPFYEEKVCDILFPGSWALAVWRKHLCLWHKKIPIFQRHPQMPEGLLYADHHNLTEVLKDFSNIAFTV